MSKKNGDTLVMPHGGVPDKNAKDKTAQKILEVEQSSSDEEASVQMQILMELKRVNSRLDAVEGQVADVRSSRQQKHLQMKFEQSKLSTSGSGQYSLKHSNNVLSSSSDSDSDENGGNFASLSSARRQRNQGSRLRELEASQDESGIDRTAKVKSKRGGPVEVMVKHKVAWPHEPILGGVNRSHMTYDQLSLSQWIQGFCKNILDESDSGKQNKMIAYMADLMEDTTDFGLQGAKAAHAVLCCELERGTVTWSDSDRIDRIRRAHAQKHTAQKRKSWNKSYDDNQKPWFCKLFQTGSCHHSKDHELGGKLHRHICASCLQRGHVLDHAERDCTVKKHSKNY